MLNRKLLKINLRRCASTVHCFRKIVVRQSKKSTSARIIPCRHLFDSHICQFSLAAKRTDANAEGIPFGSCGVDNFQIAPNEIRTHIFFLLARQFSCLLSSLSFRFSDCNTIMAEPGCYLNVFSSS
jgi:hypothetical protein